MRMAGLPQTSLIATSSRGRTVLLLMTINPDGPSRRTDRDCRGKGSLSIIRATSSASRLLS